MGKTTTLGAITPDKQALLDALANTQKSLDVEVRRQEARADAVEVLDKTGKLPSQLLQERDAKDAELQRLRAQVEAMRVAGNNMRSFVLDLQQRGTWGVTSLYEERSDKLMAAWTASLNPTPTTEAK